MNALEGGKMRTFVRFIRDQSGQDLIDWLIAIAVAALLYVTVVDPIIDTMMGKGRTALRRLRSVR